MFHACLDRIYFCSILYFAGLSYKPDACTTCRGMVGGQSMPDSFLIQDCRQAVEVMRAISSPAYLLANHHDDPILETFELSRLANIWQFGDPVFQVNGYSIKTCPLKIYFISQTLSMLTSLSCLDSCSHISWFYDLYANIACVNISALCL